VRVGALRHRLEIQEPLTAAASDGGIAHTWTTVDTVSGSIEPLAGRELLQAQAVDARVTHRITIRYYEGITPDHRIVARSRTFAIHSIVNAGERDAEFQILAEERVG